MAEQNESRPTPAQLVALIAEGWLPPEDARRSAERWGEVASYNRRLRGALQLAETFLQKVEAPPEGYQGEMLVMSEISAALANTPAEDETEVTRLRAELEAKSHGLFVADQVVAGLRAQVEGMREALESCPIVPLGGGTAALHQDHVAAWLERRAAALSQPPAPGAESAAVDIILESTEDELREALPNGEFDALAEAGKRAAQRALGAPETGPAGAIKQRDAEMALAALTVEFDRLSADLSKARAREDAAIKERDGLEARVAELEPKAMALNHVGEQREQLLAETARLREVAAKAREAMETARRELSYYKRFETGGKNTAAIEAIEELDAALALLEPAKGEEKEAPDAP